MTRDEIYESDRGERAYYQSKRSLKEQLKLPITKDGCEAILEIVSKSLDLPLDDQMRQDFAGYIHHTEITQNSFTLGELGKVFWNRFSKTATWTLDQEAKERLKEKLEKAKLEVSQAQISNKGLELAEDTSASEGEDVQAN